MADRLAGVPSKVTRLDQNGIGRALDVVRQDPVMTRETAAQFRTNPRAAIEQIFQLNPEQQAGLAALPDSQVQQIGNVVASALARDPAALEYSYSLMPVDQPGEPQEIRCKGKVKAFGIEAEFEVDTNKPQGPAKPVEAPKKE